MRVQGTSRRRVSFLFCLVSLGWTKPAPAVGVKKVPVLGGQAWGGWVCASSCLVCLATLVLNETKGCGRDRGEEKA